MTVSTNCGSTSTAADGLTRPLGRVCGTDCRTLVEQALHADLTRTNLITLFDAVTGSSTSAAPARAGLGTGRAAFDPRTVAHQHRHGGLRPGMVGPTARSTPPPAQEVRACARIALLYMLFSLTAPPPPSTACRAMQSRSERHWTERQIAIRRLFDELDDLEAALADLGQRK